MNEGGNLVLYVCTLFHFGACVSTVRTIYTVLYMNGKVVYEFTCKTSPHDISDFVRFWDV